jgi:hypothetical protein
MDGVEEVTLIDGMMVGKSDGERAVVVAVVVVTIEGASLAIDRMVGLLLLLVELLLSAIGALDGVIDTVLVVGDIVEAPLPVLEREDDDAAAVASRSVCLFLPTTTPTDTATAIKMTIKTPINIGVRLVRLSLACLEAGIPSDVMLLLLLLSIIYPEQANFGR